MLFCSACSYVGADDYFIVVTEEYVNYQCQGENISTPEEYEELLESVGSTVCPECGTQIDI